MSYFVHRSHLFVHSIQNADISLCVLPLPDVLSFASGSSEDVEIKIPSEIKKHITPSTYFLFNKSDLASQQQMSLLNESFQSQQAEGNALSILRDRSWVVSLTTGEGSHDFVRGLAESLKSRYHLVSSFCTLQLTFFIQI